MKTVKLKKKMKSKKGITLVEILIGVTIVVIVFASTLGAMVGGFTTTMYNSDENRAAVLNASLNEIILNTITKMNITDSDKAEEELEYIQSGDPTASPILAAVVATVPEATYVPAGTEFEPNIDFQYTLLPNTELPMDAGTAEPMSVNGIYIKTRFESASGPLIYESFVPFTV